MTSTTDAGIDRAQFADEWDTWHRAHEERRNDPLGFHAITGLHWLGAEPVRLDGAPGAWSSGGAGTEGTVVELRDDERLTLDGEVITDRHVLGVLPERASVFLSFTDGEVTGAIELAQRGGHTIVRPRRSDHPFLAAYPGTPAYLPDPGWRVAARFVPFDHPRPTAVGSAVDGLTHVYEAPGRLEFAWRGESFALTAFPGRGSGLLVLFTDATSGVTTYAANRAVAVDAPDKSGWTTIDFTRATNLPCAYTDFATCPLPPSENRLPIAIEAGEKTPRSRVHGETSQVPA
ncbi:MAG: DUF1684 domain-containing protein [Microbacterium sp.]|uniref:DUF1684 domain-containing protein n=1 Tax=Microbacterium sp. TaxID=51671 RepID=UPI001AC3CE98|nr:DUF1684 domain-containing protein [Microbacterium sp.]MBN9178420.1 DUF1684 domain-containing protein [Microbacterium sp.]